MRPIWAILLFAEATMFSSRAQTSEEPNWSLLDPFQGKLSQAEFVEAMDTIYAPFAEWEKWMEVDDNTVRIRTSAENSEKEYHLALSSENGGTEAKGLVATKRTDLSGLKIAIDPGHIGGSWGPMEKRSFTIGDGSVFQEGDITLATALRLEALLREQGAEVFLTRRNSEPVTSLRPIDFLEEARDRLPAKDDETGEDLEEKRRLLAERLFYRTAEIRERAKLISEFGKPDLAIALHVNASGWKDPENPSLHEHNDAHLLINGCYLDGELADDSERFQLLYRLLSRYHQSELALAESVKAAMIRTTSLPPYRYESNYAAAQDESAYIWARNLLANRLFDCPVLYLEPWQANSGAVYDWASLGDYEGLERVNGELLPSLPAVYADFVVDGLLQYFVGAEN